MANLLAGTAYIDVLPAMDKFGRTLESKFKTIGDGLATAGKKLTTRLTLPLVAFGAAAVKEAQDAAVVARKTEAALKSSGNAAVLTAEQVDAVAYSIGEMAAIDDEAAQETANLLIQMTDLTRYGDKADEVLSQMTTTVYDMASATGRSETFFTRLMATIQNTPDKALSKMETMGIITADQVEKFKAMLDAGENAAVSTELLAAASEAYAGQAAAGATESKKFKKKLDDLKETIGTFLLPKVNELVGKLNEWMDEFQKLSPKTQDMAVKAGVLAAALGPVAYFLSKILGVFKGVWIGLTAIVGVLTWLTYAFQLFAGIVLGIGISVGASFLIVIAVIAIIAGLAYLIIKNWDKVKAFFIAVWDSIKEGFQRGYEAVKNFITAAYEWVKDKLGAAAQWVTEKWQAVVRFFQELPGKVSNAFSRVKDAIINAFKAAINWVIGAWNRLDFRLDFTLPDVKFVPGLDGQRITTPDLIPDVPYLARGGIVRQPTLAMVGEAGPEAVIPLNRLGAGGTLRIVDWRRGLAELDWELDRLGMVSGE